MSRSALIVGINNFTRPEYQLKGCINDAEEMEDLLKDYYGFKTEEIRVLKDETASNEGLRKGLTWLLADYDNDGSDVRLFHFSSHGTQVEDQNQDEWECFDEVIVPYDHDRDTPFRDDELWDYFKDIPEFVNFTFIADCCHSGTMQRPIRNDIIFNPRQIYPDRIVRDEIVALQKERDAQLRIYQAAQLATLMQGVPPDQWENKLGEFLALTEEQFKSDWVAVVPFERHFLLSGCEDRQTSADAYIEGSWRGAFSWGLAKAIKETNGNLTYKDLITKAGASIRDYDQRPQLECPEVLRDHRFLAPLDQ